MILLFWLEHRAQCELVMAQLVHIMLLLELVFILNTTAREHPEAAVALIDRSLHHLEPHASAEQCDELQASRRNQEQNRVFDLISIHEGVILASLEEEAQVDDCDHDD